MPPSSCDFDLVVIGAGSGGVRASRVAAGLGARVAVVESGRMGGTCVNLGCVPKKLFVYSAELGEAAEDGPGFGWTFPKPRFDWAQLVASKDREITRLNGIYRRLLENAGVTVIEGHARITDPRTVAVGADRYSAEHILVATGSTPYVPEMPGRDLVATSDDVFHLPDLPRRIVVVGGGYIAVEFAGIFRGLGRDVTLVHRGPQPLRGFDADIREAVLDEVRKRGVETRMDTLVEAVEPHGNHLHAQLSDGSTLTADLVMMATGRLPRTDGLDLDEVGVRTDARGAITVNTHYQSSIHTIHAVGDVIGRVPLTPVALAEGTALAHTLFGDGPRAVDYDCIPTAVFSNPSVGTVGLTEAMARRRHGEVDVYRSRFRPMRHTMTGRDEKTLMKLLVARESQRVVGCHVMGPHAGEIVQGFAVAMKCGATKADLDATVGIHPTAAEELVTMRTPVPSPG